MRNNVEHFSTLNGFSGLTAIEIDEYGKIRDIIRRAQASHFPLDAALFPPPEDTTDVHKIRNWLSRAKESLLRKGWHILQTSIEKPQVPALFSILDQFSEYRKRCLYQDIEHEGETVTLTPELVDFLLLNWSIGTPPTTDRSKEVIRTMILGTANPYEIEEFLPFMNFSQSECHNFISFARYLQKGLSQTDHYSTDTEIRSHEKQTQEFPGFEGASLFRRSILSCSPSQAKNLLKQHVFKSSRYRLEFFDTDCVDSSLMSTMQENPDKIFIVMTKQMPSHIWNDVRWNEYLPRLICIDNSDLAQKTNTCHVYSLFSDTTDKIDQHHILAKGKPSAPQLTMREILEHFSSDHLSLYQQEIKKLFSFKNSALQKITFGNADEDTRKTVVRDWFVLRQYLGQAEFFHLASSLSPQEFSQYTASLQQKVGENWMKYMFSTLDKQKYKHSIGPDGGRGGLGLVSRLRLREIREAVGHFRQNQDPSLSLSEYYDQLSQWQEECGYTSFQSHDVLQKSQDGYRDSSFFRKSSDKTLKQGYFRRFTENVFQKLEKKTQDILLQTILPLLGLSKDALAKNPSVILSWLVKLDAHISSSLFSSDEDSDPNSDIGKMLRQLQDRCAKPQQKIVQWLYSFFLQYAPTLDKPEIAESLLNDIETTGKLPGHLIMEKIRWTYGNVFSPDDFSSFSFSDLNISIEWDDYRPNTKKLWEDFARVRILLRKTPALFELFCKSCTLIINSPHNPSGHIYQEEDILAILDIAAEFGLTIVDDNAYYKIIRKRPGDKGRPRVLPIAEIYELHKDRYHGKPVRILTVASPTKNLIGANYRLNMLLYQPDDESCEHFLTSQMPKDGDGTAMGHPWSLFMLNEELKASLSIKKFRPILEELKRSFTLDECLEKWRSTLAPLQILEAGASLNVYEKIMEAYYLLCVLPGRGAGMREVRKLIDRLLEDLKYMRPDKMVARDMDFRFEAAEEVLEKIQMSREFDVPFSFYRSPDGAFYIPLENILTFPKADAENGNGVLLGDKSLVDFLILLCRYTGVAFAPYQKTGIRLSLGGNLSGEKEGYQLQQMRLELSLKILFSFWKHYVTYKDNKEFEDFLSSGFSVQDIISKYKAPLLSQSSLFLAQKKKWEIFPPNEWVDDCIFQLEPTSQALDVVTGVADCRDVRDFLQNDTFKYLYAFLLENFYKEIPALCDRDFGSVLAQFNTDRLSSAYEQNSQEISAEEKEIFQIIVARLLQAWYGVTIRTSLLYPLNEHLSSLEKRKLLQGICYTVGGFLDQIYDSLLKESFEKRHGFSRAFELISDVRPPESLRSEWQQLISQIDFIGVTEQANPAVRYNSELSKRSGGGERAFVDRTIFGNETPDELHTKLFNFLQLLIQSRSFVGKVVSNGWQNELLVIHKSFFHFLQDVARLFSDIDIFCDKTFLNQCKFDSILFFGLPKKVMGDHMKTGCFYEDFASNSGSPSVLPERVPIGWVAKSNDTDYFGSLKKWLMVHHNLTALERGALPIHGALITLHFKDGSHFTFVASGDSGTGKSELLAKIMELIDTMGFEAQLDSIEILALDMLTLAKERNGDRIFGFGTETGDFSRQDDLQDTEWAKKYSHLFHLASITNPSVENARATIPGLCDPKEIRIPREIDAIFYFNNFLEVSGSRIQEMNIRDTLLAIQKGYRFNKGTSEDLPDFNAGVEYHPRKRHLVNQFDFNKSLGWYRDEKNKGKAEIYMGYKDGMGHITDALQAAKYLFHGECITHKNSKTNIVGVEYLPLENKFLLKGHDGSFIPLTLQTYLQVYPSISSVWFSSHFGHTSHPQHVENVVAKMTESITKGQSIIGGVIYTGLGTKDPQACLHQAAKEVVAFFNNPSVKMRYEMVWSEVKDAIRSKLQDEALSIPTEIIALNMKRYYSWKSRQVALDANITTPYFTNKGPKKDATFIPQLVHPEIASAIRDAFRNRSERDFQLTPEQKQLCEGLRYHDEDGNSDIYELVYQIMLKLGWCTLEDAAVNLRQKPYLLSRAMNVVQSLYGDVYQDFRKKMKAGR